MMPDLFDFVCVFAYGQGFAIDVVAIDVINH